MSEEAKADPIHYSDWSTLLGFYDENFALQYVKNQAVDNLRSDDAWLAKIRSAIYAVGRISDRLQLRPEIMPLDSRFRERMEALEREPTFREHLGGMTSRSFAMVELASIHCFQVQLNSEYIDSLVVSAPDPNDLEETVRFCLPTHDERRKAQLVTSINPVSHTFSATTENLDFRIGENVQGDDTSTGRNFAGFTYGSGLPQISVVDYKGTILLKNGYHRAFALLKKGHRFLPCLLLATDNYQATGGQVQGFFPIDLVFSDKSPVLSDFGSTAAVAVPRRRLRVMVTVHAEVQVIPL